MRGLGLAAACLLLVGLLSVPGAAQPLERDLIEKARAYFDPAREFLWRARKDLLKACEAARGKDWLKDLDFLRALVYQGRHFLERFDDRAWQHDHEVTRFEVTQDLYRSVRSEQWQFTWTVPFRYPTESALERIPRADPLPLLFVLHDEEDSGADFPGAAALARRYPKDAWRDLYDRFLTLAPVAPRGLFLDADGVIRHRFATAVLTEFWRRYDVDFDRIVLDGGTAAAAMAAAFPHVFAGLVLRDGARVDPDLVGNYASVPVFVTDEGLAEVLRAGGHRDVTVGGDADLGPWLERRRRVVPRTFTWRMKNPDHVYPNWVAISRPDHGAAQRTLSVLVLDTEDDPNTISLRAEGIDAVSVHLNDEIVDLDREVRIVANGEEVLRRRFERDFGRLFDKDPYVRKNMNFGWLYPVQVVDIALSDVPGPPSGPPEEPIAPRPRETPPEELRIAVQDDWLRGRPDLIERHLGAPGAAYPPEYLLPFALRDLWWRRAWDTDIGTWTWRTAETASGIVRDQLEWILGGGEGPYPHHEDPRLDPWPILTALVLERVQRETTGAAWLPDESPLLTRPPPEALREAIGTYAGWFYDGIMRIAYEGEDPARLPPALKEADAEQGRLAREAGSRNTWLAILVGVLFLGGPLVLGRRLGRP